MNGTGTGLVRYLRTLADGRANDACTDRQLLEQFVTRREQASFAALVRRHGPMVLSVCRRVLSHDHDAEDAFQATFLVLVRKAGSIRKHESVSSWLHGVAFHVAEKLRSKEARRMIHERKAATRPTVDPVDDIAWREIRCLLDSELARLPEQYRGPLVLCYLQGKTQDEAARQLEWSLRTFRRRLQRARDLLTRRLTRRGVTLSAALSAPLLTDTATQAALPPLLAASTVRAGMASAMGQAIDTLVSAQVIALAQCGVGSLLMKKAILAVVVLVSLTLGLGSLFVHRAVQGHALAEAQVTPKSAPTPPQPQTPPADKDKRIEIKGRVLDPDGKPVTGVGLFLRSVNNHKKSGMSVRATTDKDGLFSFKATPPDFDAEGKATLAAVAKGFGPDWNTVKVDNKEEVTLRLVKDDVPIEGRVLDLEGKPLAGVTIEVSRLARKGNDQDLTEWLNQNARPGGQLGWENGLQSVSTDFLDVPGTTTTGADGKFQLSGFGGERVLRLKVHGPTIEHRVFWAMTRKGPSKGLRPGDYGFYAAMFDMVVGPAKPIVGTVRDKSSGKPLEGIAIRDGRGKGRAITDKNGRFRLLGIAKQTEYVLTAGGDEGRPYFDVSKFNVADSPGLEPLTVDFELERGIEVTGRLSDRVTGQPVRGNVHYFTPPDNPNLKNYATLGGLKVSISPWGETQPDGTFTVLTIPGQGVLVACIEEGGDRFALIDASRELQKMKIFSAPVAPAYAIVRINPDEKTPKSLRCDIALEPGRTLSGLLTDPEGRPLTGVHCAGLSATRFLITFAGYSRPLSQGLKSAEFIAHGLRPQRPRAVVFFHPEKKLGRILHLRGDEKAPVTVELEALGGVRGRIVDANGKPLAGLQVTVSLDGQLPVKNDALSTDLFESGLAERMTARGTTDANGKFRIDGLLPGVPYSLHASEKHGNQETPVTSPVDVPNIESGKTKNLGDLKGQLVPEKGSEAKP